MKLLGADDVYFAFDLATMLVCVTVFLFSLIHQRTDKEQNRVFLILVSIVFFNGFCELLNNALSPFRDSDSIFRIIDVTVLLYFIFHSALAPSFFYYVSCVCGAVTKLTRKRFLWFASIFFLTEAAVFSNPATHWIYYYDNDRLYHRGSAVFSLYLAAAIYFALAVSKLLFSWDALTKKKRLTLMYFFAIAIIGVITQMFFVKMKVELFAESLAMIGAMLSIENEDDRIDPETGVYNRRAFETDLDTYFVNKTLMKLICVKITNSDIVDRTLSSEKVNQLAPMIAEMLKTFVPRYNIYMTSDDTFMLTVFERSEAEADMMIKKISERFETAWILGDSYVLLNAVVMAANVPLRISSTSDALYMADSPVPDNIEKKILLDSDLDYLMRRAAVEKAITRGLEEGTFEVYYQPTYSLKERKLHGAEALLRLHDSVLGNVFPNEFIPIAEHMGLIDELDDFVLREVCIFLKSGTPVKCGMDCINVNLSVIQCMRPGFVERIKGIVSGMGVKSKLINFEITETVAASDYSMLSRTIDALKSEGFLFSMDDYGTGYSNMQSIFSLDFDVVKIDKSILWSAEKGELGRIILENSVRMIKQMDRRILVEGVETQSQIDMLEEMDVDYLQGYFFSRPVPKKDLIELIQKK